MDLAEQVIQIRGSDADGNEAEQARFPGQPQRARPSHTGGSGAVAWTKKKPLAVWRGAPTGAVGSAASVKAAISVRWNDTRLLASKLPSVSGGMTLRGC